MQGAFQSEALDGDVGTQVAKEQRLAQTAQWLKYCQEIFLEFFGMNIEFKESSAIEINHHYWETLEDQVRPRIKSKSGDGVVVVNRHKICSLLELVIMYVEPIEFVDKKTLTQEKLNSLHARIAYFIAQNIIANWQHEKLDTLNVGDEFRREHLALLENIQSYSEDWPIFSNAATWHLFEELCIARSNSVVAP